MQARNTVPVANHEKMLGDDKINFLLLDLMRSTWSMMTMVMKPLFPIRRLLLPHGNKLFGYCGPLCRAILDKKFKSKLPNVGRNIDCITDLFDCLAKYQVSMHLQRVTNEVMYHVFTMTLEKGMCLVQQSSPELNQVIWSVLTRIHSIVFCNQEYEENHGIPP